MTNAVGVGAGPLVDRLGSSRMLATVRELADERFAGRRVGTAGGAAASAWLADRLRELGARVVLDDFDVPAVREVYRTPVLEWDDGTAVRGLTFRRDFCEHLASAEVPLPRTGGLVADAAVEVRGRWVVASADWAGLADRAEREGAAGVLVPRGVDEAGWMPKMIAGPRSRAVPIVAVRTDLHDRMLGVGGALTASMPLRTVAVRGANVYGDLRVAESGRLTILLTAHYDGVGDDPDCRFPAAADNASGVAAILEAAAVLHATLPTGVGLAVALLDGEEAGARGSAHHAPQLRPDTWVINLDGAAQLNEAASVEAGGPAHAMLAALDQAGRDVGVRLRAGSMASDNRRYAAAGLPAIGIGMGIPGYQTPAETPDRVDPATLRSAAELVVATGWRLAI